MKRMLIFLLIIAPILHQSNCAPPGHDDVLLVTIKKDWHNYDGYEFLGKLAYAKDRYKVHLFHLSQPNVVIWPSNSETNPRADVFYFPNEKKYKAEELGVRIDVEKQGQVILRKNVGEVSILPGGGMVEPPFFIPTREQEGQEGQILTMDEMEAELERLKSVKAKQLANCRADSIKCMEGQWPVYYIARRQNELAGELLERMRQEARQLGFEGKTLPEQLNMENLEKGQKALEQAKSKCDERHKQLVEWQSQLLFGNKPETAPPPQSEPSYANERPMMVKPLQAIPSKGGPSNDFGMFPTGASGSQQFLMPTPRHASKNPFSSAYSGAKFIFNNPLDSGTSGQFNPSRMFDLNQPSTSPSSPEHPNSSVGQPQFVPSQSNSPPSDSGLDGSAASHNANERPMLVKPLQAIPSKDTQILHMEEGMGKREKSAEMQEEEPESKVIRKLKREWLTLYFDQINSNPSRNECQEIATVLHKKGQQILDWFNNHRKNYSRNIMTKEERGKNRKYRDEFMETMRQEFPKQLEKEELKWRKNAGIAEKGKGKRPASPSENQQQQGKRAKKFSDFERVWLVAYRDNVDIHPFKKERQEIATILGNKSELEIDNWFNNNRKDAVKKTMTKEEREKLHARFMVEMRQLFPNGLLPEKMGNQQEEEDLQNQSDHHFVVESAPMDEGEN